MKLPNPDSPIEAQEEDVLLAMCVWGESRGECLEAKIGVANVVLNRVRCGRYGSGIRGVILRRWQFSSFNVADPNRAKLLHPSAHDSVGAWQASWDAAQHALLANQAGVDNTHGATHYFDDSMAATPPTWAKQFQPTVKIGSLNFYRDRPRMERQGA